MNKNFERIYQSKPEILPEIEEFVEKQIADLSLSEDVRNNIELSVAEAAANCVLHGNKNDPSKNVILKLTITKSKIEISFTDEGSGFNPEDVPDPTIPENILKGSGRGLHIMRSLVDEMKYKFHDHGTELIISFNI